MSPTSGQPPVADRTIEIRPGGVWVITLRGLLTATTIQAAKKRVLQAAALLRYHKSPDMTVNQTAVIYGFLGEASPDLTRALKIHIALRRN